MRKDRDYIAVEPFSMIPYLVHGFGTSHLKERSIALNADFSGFFPISLRQTHSDIIRVITESLPERSEGDAMVTDLPGVLLIIKTADCLPVLAVDIQNRAVAAIHCGWRGTLKRIVEKTILTMHHNYGSDYASLCVALGPCISPTCYEVGEEVRKQFERKGLHRGVFSTHPSHKKKYVLDLRKANRTQLLALGVQEKNIFSVDRCTYSEKDLFSYRRDREGAGRLINFIGISP
jgi:YfiH family protein